MRARSTPYQARIQQANYHQPEGIGDSELSGDQTHEQCHEQEQDQITNEQGEVNHHTPFSDELYHASFS